MEAQTKNKLATGWSWLALGLLCISSVGMADLIPFKNGSMNRSQRSCAGGGVYTLVEAPSSGATWQGSTTGDSTVVLVGPAGANTVTMEATSGTPVHCGQNSTGTGTDTNYPTTSTYYGASTTMVTPNASSPGRLYPQQFFRDTNPSPGTRYACADVLNSGATCCLNLGGTCNKFFWKVYQAN